MSDLKISHIGYLLYINYFESNYHKKWWLFYENLSLRK